MALTRSPFWPPETSLTASCSEPHATLAAVANATISLARRHATPALAQAVGDELRRLRRLRRLTQRELAAPLTGAYVSAIEAGRVFPSLPALALLLDRLDVDLATYFTAVDPARRAGNRKRLDRAQGETV